MLELTKNLLQKVNIKRLKFSLCLTVVKNEEQKMEAEQKQKLKQNENGEEGGKHNDKAAIQLVKEFDQLGHYQLSQPVVQSDQTPKNDGFLL